MLRKMGLAILLLVITFRAQALTEARLINHSTSGQTVVFNLGTHDGIKEGDYAVVVKQIRDLKSRDLRLIPAAKARNVKINSDSSVWILYRIFDQELLVRGDKFLVLSESHMLSGRRPPLLGRVQYTTNKGKTKVQMENFGSDDKDRLSKLKSRYETITPTHEERSGSDTDAQLADLEVWKEHKDDRYRSSIYKSANKEEWTRQLRLATFEKLVTAYLERVNDPDFNYDTFYEYQRKTAFANEFVVNANLDSEYNRFLRKESAKASADAKLFRSILEKGGSWSEEYSDEELHTVLNEVSVLQEADRRKVVVSKPTRYSVAIDYGSYLNDAQTDSDTNYKRDSRYSTELDFEATPFLKHETLERFTLNGTIRLNHTAFEANSYNADLEERSVTIGANWYPLYAPYAVESAVIILGTYFRTGLAAAESPTLGEKANYTLFSLPGIRAGMKYLMRNNFGIRLIVSMETLKLERYESSQYNSNLPESTNLVEAKLNIGLAYAF